MIIDNRSVKHKHMYDIDVNMPITTEIHLFKPSKPNFNKFITVSYSYRTIEHIYGTI